MQIRRLGLVTFTVLAIALLAAQTAHAAFIVKPTDVPVFESEFSGREAVDSINASGLSADLETGDPIPVVFPTHDTNVNSMWLTAVPDTETFIVFDLGEESILFGLHLWNYNEAGSFRFRGINDVDISFSTTSAVAGFGNTINVDFAAASGAAGDPGESIFFPAPIEAEFVRFDINSNHGGNHTGISEVRFFATIVPEPSSCGLLAAGGLLVVRRRRRGRR